MHGKGKRFIMQNLFQLNNLEARKLDAIAGTPNLNNSKLSGTTFSYYAQHQDIVFLNLLRNRMFNIVSLICIVQPQCQCRSSNVTYSLQVLLHSKRCFTYRYFT